MQQLIKQAYEFGPFRLDPVKRVLLKEGEPVQLTPKALDTLLALIEGSGQLLEKDELIRRVWPNCFVEEGNLTVNISTLRKALGENRGEHHYIVTVPGRGYRFVAEMREVSAGSDPEAARFAAHSFITPHASFLVSARGLPARVRDARVSKRAKDTPGQQSAGSFEGIFMLLPRTLGELKSSEYNEARVRHSSVKDEMRRNLIGKLERQKAVFPGIVGYDDSVIPQIINAILSRHNFILLGLRGQAKSRILRELANLLDPAMPTIEGCEINDNPYQPLCKACRMVVEQRGDQTPITFVPRGNRYVEKLATPDVTIADLIGDLDPIKAARGGHLLSDELTIHYGLLPRANRGIFAINELPDLASKVQVGLFNIMQEGDVQIKGYPIRLPLDVLLVFSANPEDYTARGKIITPLKDRIGSEIITHYPATVEEGIEITKQEAWTARDGDGVLVPEFIHRAVEQIAFEARDDQRIDRRSGVSQRLPISVIENVVSNAERRRLQTREARAVPRISDIYAALPSITGKLELEYEGEQKGAANVARDLVRTAVGKVFEAYCGHLDCSEIIAWFNDGGTLRIGDSDSAALCLKGFRTIDGLLKAAAESHLAEASQADILVAACELILEGLHAQKKISRSEERGYTAVKPEPRSYGYESFSRSRKIN